MKATVILLFAVFALVSPALSQNTATALSPLEREEAINNMCELLNRFYVFPDVAAQMEGHIKSKLAQGALDAITDPHDFVDYVTTELRSVCHDLHFRLFIGANPDEQTPEDRNLTRLRNRLDRRKDNYGLPKVEILDGNVGYMKIESVGNSREARDVLLSALTFLSQTDAIIFDLRINHGGDPGFMAYIFSYFFDKPTHINSIYWRDRDRTTEYWTREDVPGERLVDLPLFVLISKETYSGGEEFAYDLQALKRATIIGETSAGGANPASSWVVLRDIRISIPHGRAINPVTNTNWEGVGVIPDIEVPVENALDVAIEHAKRAADEYQTTQWNRIFAVYAECKTGLEKAGKLFEDGDTLEAEALVLSSLKSAIDQDVLDESSINGLGYDYLARDNALMAIAIFRGNVSAYPESANVYDSLGEAYLKSGNKELAKYNYEKALEIDPNMPSAKQALEDIGK